MHLPFIVKIYALLFAYMYTPGNARNTAPKIKKALQTVPTKSTASTKLEVLATGIPGSESLGAALAILNYSVYDLEMVTDESSLPHIKFWNEVYSDCRISGERTQIMLSELQFNAVAGFPAFLCLEYFLKVDPNIKVIHSEYSSSELWWSSIQNETHRVNRFSAFPFNTLAKIAPTFKHMKKLNQNLWGSFTLAFNATDPWNDKTRMVAAYETHNRLVRRVVPRRRLLVLTVDKCDNDRWDRLCKFLGRRQPDTTYPHVDSTSKFNQASKFYAVNLVCIPIFLVLGLWASLCLLNGPSTSFKRKRKHQAYSR